VTEVPQQVTAKQPLLYMEAEKAAAWPSATIVSHVWHVVIGSLLSKPFPTMWHRNSFAQLAATWTEVANSLHVIWTHEGMDQAITGASEGFYRETFDELEAFAAVLRGTTGIPLPVPDSVASQRQRCQALADAAWAQWREDCPGTFDQAQLRAADLGYDLMLISVAPLEDVQQASGSGASSSGGSGLVPQQAVAMGAASSAQSKPSADMHTWLTNWASDIGALVKKAVNDKVSFASVLWMPPFGAPWLAQQLATMSEITTVAGERISELIAFIDVHADSASIDGQHPILASLRDHFDSDRFVHELTVKTWIAAFGVTTVTLLVNNFVHTESDKGWWTQALSRAVLTCAA
jgi:hypothetical protein